MICIVYANASYFAVFVHSLWHTEMSLISKNVRSIAILLDVITATPTLSPDVATIHPEATADQ